MIPHNSFGSSPLTNCVSVRGISERKKKKLNADDAQRGIFRFALTVPKIFRDYLRPQLCRLHDRSKNKKKLKYFLFFLFFFDLCPHLKKKNRILPRFLVSNFLSYLLCTSFYSVIISSSAYGPALSLLLPSLLLLLPAVARIERDQTHSLLLRNDAKLLRRAIYLFCFFLSFFPPAKKLFFNPRLGALVRLHSISFSSFFSPTPYASSKWIQSCARALLPRFFASRI